jgi:uncharacterized membrane protein HdeD (DUF308 family)
MDMRYTLHCKALDGKPRRTDLPLVPAPPRDVAALHDRALQDLSFIRQTMAGASAFTDVPGWGLVTMGGLGALAAWLAARQPTPERWLLTWMGTAAVAVTVGSLAMWRKMRRRVRQAGDPVLTTPARRFMLGFWPAILAGALLTFALIDPATPGLDPRALRLLPGTWLTLYGVGVTTAGAFSVRAVPLMGIGFLVLGAIALFLPRGGGDLLLGLGFGAWQAGVGAYIARSHGG